MLTCLCVACDWSLGVPQLFWIFSAASKSSAKMIQTCSQVTLLRVPVDLNGHVGIAPRVSSRAGDVDQSC